MLRQEVSTAGAGCDWVQCCRKIHMLIASLVLRSNSSTKAKGVIPVVKRAEQHMGAWWPHWGQGDVAVPQVRCEPSMALRGAV